MDFGALVRSGRVPSVDGFFRADGSIRRVLYDGPQLSFFRLGAVFVPDWAYEAHDLVEIDWAQRTDLPGEPGSVCCGEGPLGADGFFARLDAAGVPVWVAFMTNSNPFHHVRVDGPQATFTNNLGRPLVVDLDQPDYCT